jgi:plasmid maintenance system antidote protein VapI
VAEYVDRWLDRSDKPVSELSEAIQAHRFALSRIRRGHRRIYLDEALMLLDALGEEPIELLELQQALKRGQVGEISRSSHWEY